MSDYAKTLKGVAKRFYLDLSDLHTMGQQITTKVAIPPLEDAQLVLPVEIYVDKNKPEESILQQLSQQISLELSYQFLPDDAQIEAVLDAKPRLAYDNYDAGHAVQEYQRKFNALNQAAYEIKRLWATRYAPGQPKRKKLDIKRQLFAFLFIQWCYEQWKLNAQLPFLEYPEKACLSLNTISAFNTDLHIQMQDNICQIPLKLDIDDEAMQQKVMNGLGVTDH